MRFGTPICPSLGRPGAWGLPGHRIFAALALFRSAGRLSGFPGGLSGPSETRFGTAIIASGENPAPRSRGGSGRRGLPPRGRIWPKSLCFPVAPGSLGGARIGPSGAAAGPGAGGRGGCGGACAGGHPSRAAGVLPPTLRQWPRWPPVERPQLTIPKVRKCGRQHADVGTCHVADWAPAQPIRHAEVCVPRVPWPACAARAAGAPAHLNFCTEIRAPRAQKPARAPQPSFSTV